jgi:hypothetical protein
MAELETREQALAYLAQMSPSETYQVQPFQHGWVATKVLSPEQITAGQGVGLARLVIDSETATVYQYPSWSETMVAEAHTTFKQTGRNQAANQIYPHQWEITIRRTKEDPTRIGYQLTAVSLSNPPEPNQEHTLTIEKDTYLSEPRDPLSKVAAAHARWVSGQNQGVWPETDITHR